MNAPDSAVSADAALSPLRADILRRARDYAEDVLRQACAYADARHARAAAECEAITAGAVAAGRARAVAELARRRHRAAERGQNMVLAAQCRAYDHWRAAATTAVLDLRDEPGYAALRETLCAAAGRVLGPELTVEDDPAGGIVARSRGRVLDLRLSAIAARAVEQVETDIAGLWS